MFVVVVLAELMSLPVEVLCIEVPRLTLPASALGLPNAVTAAMQPVASSVKNECRIVMIASVPNSPAIVSSIE